MEKRSDEQRPSAADVAARLKATAPQIKRKFLDIWTAEKICGKNTLDSAARPLTRLMIDEYTEGKLKETISYAVDNSPFYEQKLQLYMQPVLWQKKPLQAASLPGCTQKKDCDDKNAYDDSFWQAFRKLPFTTATELRSRGTEFLCVSPNVISRIVTLDTGGSTGKPKRIYFTEEDQQLTVDYFANGMQLIVDSSDKVLILMPTKMPGSIGGLLARGLETLGAKVVAYGLPGMEQLPEHTVEMHEIKITDAAELEDKATKEVSEDKTHDKAYEAVKLLRLISDEGITSVVALPTHMRMLSEALKQIQGHKRDVCSDADDIATAGCRTEDISNERSFDDLSLCSVLLSAEYVSGEDVRLIETAFDCQVYEHYGMTEMGLGCAVSCGQGEGYHIREGDLYIEIIDPETGETIEDDRTGEIVFTTLTRKGMPFIRYRTGDYSHWIAEECPCGSVLKRLAKVGPRKEIKGYLR